MRRDEASLQKAGVDSDTHTQKKKTAQNNRADQTLLMLDI